MAAAMLVASTAEPIEPCIGLSPPVDGQVGRGFAPTGRYSGHWGVDWVVPVGTEVRAAAPGTVSFAGTVAGNLTVTVDHGGSLRTSYSYLSAVSVERSDPVTESTTLGASGAGHGSPALHFSVRIGPTYVDPVAIIGCRLAKPAKALRLVPVRDVR
jgi:murein DD-endopeptidase MepM/ murein hydrolase activator NlpD